MIARILASGLSEPLGQQVIVENVGGAGGMIGTARVAKAAPDGYQVILGNVGTHADNQTLYRRPLYNTATDFAPVFLVVELPLARPLVGHPSLASAHEQGLENFDVINWFGLFLPKGTPTAIVAKLHDATAAAMETASLQAQMKKAGADLIAPERRSAAYLQTFVASEIDKWAGPIKASGLCADERRSGKGPGRSPPVGLA